MMIKTPGNVIELIENLHSAFKSRHVFDEAFYTEENIRKVTAARNIEVIRGPGEARLAVETFDFRSIANNLESYGGGLTVDFFLETWASGKKSAVIRCHVSSEQPLLHYLVIEKIFAYPWQTKMPELWGTNQLYREPTDPYGNAEKEYRYKDGNITEEVSFEFDPAGCLSDAIFRSEKE